MSNYFEDRAFVEIVHEKLWVKQVPLRFFGVQIGTRMTVIRLPENHLFVHSPIALTPATKASLNMLGAVTYVVSPNNMHHLFIGDYFEAYPSARIYASPGLREKREDLQFYKILGDKPEYDWSQFIDQMIFYGGSTLKEVVFFHRETRTLIVADLLMNFQENSPPLTKFLTNIAGAYQIPTSPIGAEADETQRVIARKSVMRILEWDFDRIILSHGDIIHTGGKAIFCQAFADFI